MMSDRELEAETPDSLELSAMLCVCAAALCSGGRATSAWLWRVAKVV